MPDTGAPWNIPYVAGTDLVSDWPTDSLALANAIDAGLDAASVGIGSNVVQTVKTDTFTSSSTSFVTVTGLSATITPSSATAKVLVVVQISTSFNAVGGAFYKVTGGNTSSYVGASPGSRVAAVFGGFNQADELEYTMVSQSIVFLDSPATTSATTYQVEARGTSTGPGVYVNRSADDFNGANRGRGASSITLIEVKA